MCLNLKLLKGRGRPSNEQKSVNDKLRLMEVSMLLLDWWYKE